jgi:hypothetical protein
MDESMSELTAAGQRIGRIPDASSPELLPREAPLDMPDQDFGKRGGGAHRARRGYWIPRAALFAGSLVLTAAFGYELYGVLGLEQLTPIQLLFLVLSTIAFGWIAIGSLNAALGFLPLFAGEKVDTIELPSPEGPLTTRTRRERSRGSRAACAASSPSTIAAAVTTRGASPETSRTGCAASAPPTTTSSCSTATASCRGRRLRV